MIYNTALISQLATKSFVGRSGDQFYSSYFKAVQAWEEGAKRTSRGVTTRAVALREALDTERELLDELEGDDDAWEAHNLELDARKPSVDEVHLYLRYKCGDFQRPRRRGRGTSNWERAQALEANPFKLALLEVIRIVKAKPGVEEACEKAVDKASEYMDSFDGWPIEWGDATIGWQARKDDLERCEDPEEFCPEEEIGTWLQQIQDMQLLAGMADDTPIGEYS